MRGQKERAENQYIPGILLNNLRVNGDKISVELKQDLYENLFKRYRKVTVKRLRNYLIQEGIVEKRGGFVWDRRGFQSIVEVLS